MGYRGNVIIFLSTRVHSSESLCVMRYVRSYSPTSIVPPPYQCISIDKPKNNTQINIVKNHFNHIAIINYEVRQKRGYFQASYRYEISTQFQSMIDRYFGLVGPGKRVNKVLFHLFVFNNGSALRQGHNLKWWAPRGVPNIWCTLM